MSSVPADAPALASTAGWLRRSGRVGLLIASAAYILPHGAPDALPLFLAATAIGLVAAVAALSPARQRAVRQFALEVMILAVLLALYVLFQAWSFGGNPFANAVWLRAESLAGATSRAVSVEPSSTYAALFTLLGPLLAYYAVLQLFDDDRSAVRLLKVIAAAGCLVGLHGLLQMLAFPHGLFLSARPGGADLTGIFVNRNTAGTFLGIGSLASLGWLVGALSAESGSGSRARTVAGIAGQYRQTIVAGACLAICILCLFLTRSRGAMLSWLAAFAVVVPLIAFNYARLWPRWARGSASRFRPLVLAGLGLVAVVALAQFFGGRTAARLGQDGVDFARLCVYAATIRGFEENWLFGTGFGTFASVFPQYRTADCVDIYLTFFRAHNSYLEALLGLGIVFVPVVVYAYCRLGIVMYRGYRARIRLRSMPIVGIGGIVLVTMHSLTDFSLQIPGMAVYFACFLGAVSVISLGRKAASADAAHRARGRASHEPEMVGG